MILILNPEVTKDSPEFPALMEYLGNLRNVQVRLHEEHGAQQTVTEVYLIGDTAALELADMEVLPGVERVVRISEEYRVLGRHKDDQRPTSFEYNGLHFGQDNLSVFAGLCAVDTPEHVEQMMRALREHGQVCTRMGAYKPRTNPYSFQGHGKTCLPYVFELAGKYGIKVIAMEVTHESHVHEIREALHQTGNPTGVMFQIGTRNTQNFELLKAVGRQNEHPVLLKRGFGITLEESLNAAEYLASEGNRKVIFGLRGMKTNMGDPHRNFVDFAHVPVVAEANALDDAAVADVQAGNYASRENDPASCLVSVPSSSALPVMAAAAPQARRASRSVTSRTPPEACRPISGKRATNSPYSSTFGPVSAPSRLMSVHSTWLSGGSANRSTACHSVSSESRVQPWLVTRGMPRSSSRTSSAITMCCGPASRSQPVTVSGRLTAWLPMTTRSTPQWNSRCSRSWSRMPPPTCTVRAVSRAMARMMSRLAGSPVRAPSRSTT